MDGKSLYRAHVLLVEDVLDLVAINEAKEMMKAQFSTMLEYFLEDAETYIEKVREGIAANNAQKIVMPVHTLTSSSRQMGAIKMAEIGKKMEVMAHEQCRSSTNDMVLFAEMLDKLEVAFSETKDVFKQHAA